jgi:hypothetical protein
MQEGMASRAVYSQVSYAQKPANLEEPPIFAYMVSR